MAIELEQKGIGFSREFDMPIFYKGKQVGLRRVDFLIENLLSVELKAIKMLEDLQMAQALNYLEAYNLEIGLLVNFGSQKLEFKRLLNPRFRR